jgi:hypothetical protein
VWKFLILLPRNGLAKSKVGLKVREKKQFVELHLSKGFVGFGKFTDEQNQFSQFLVIVLKFGLFPPCPHNHSLHIHCDPLCRVVSSLPQALRNRVG